MHRQTSKISKGQSLISTQDILIGMWWTLADNYNVSSNPEIYHNIK